MNSEYLLWKEARDKSEIVFEWEHTLYRAKNSLDTLMWLNKEEKALTIERGREYHSFLQCWSYVEYDVSESSPSHTD